MSSWRARIAAEIMRSIGSYGAEKRYLCQILYSNCTVLLGLHELSPTGNPRNQGTRAVIFQHLTTATLALAAFTLETFMSIPRQPAKW